MKNYRIDSGGPHKFSQDLQWENTKFKKLASAPQRKIMQVIKTMPIKSMKQYGKTQSEKKSSYRIGCTEWLQQEEREENTLRGLAAALLGENCA